MVTSAVSASASGSLFVSPGSGTGFRPDLLAVLSLLIAAGSGHAEEFRWKVAAGETLSIELRQEITATSRCSGQERVETSSATIGLAIEITAADDEGFTSIQSIQSVSLKLGAPTGDGAGLITLDTGRTEKLKGVAEELRKELIALKGARFTVRQRPDGSVVSVEADPATLEQFRAAPATSPLQLLLTPEGLTRLFGDSQMVLPAGDVKPGDTWLFPEVTAGDAASDPAPPVTATAAPPQLKWEYAGMVEREQRELHRFAASLPAGQASAGTSEDENRKLELKGDFLFDQSGGIPHSGTITSKMTATSRYRDLVIETVVNSVTSLDVSRN